MEGTGFAVKEVVLGLHWFFSTVLHGIVQWATNSPSHLQNRILIEYDKYKCAHGFHRQLSNVDVAVVSRNVTSLLPGRAASRRWRLTLGKMSTLSKCWQSKLLFCLNLSSICNQRMLFAGFVMFSFGFVVEANCIACSFCASLLDPASQPANNMGI